MRHFEPNSNSSQPSIPHLTEFEQQQQDQNTRLHQQVALPTVCQSGTTLTMTEHHPQLVLMKAGMQGAHHLMRTESNVPSASEQSV